jgi:hypothetical protein
VRAGAAAIDGQVIGMPGDDRRVGATPGGPDIYTVADR